MQQYSGLYLRQERREAATFEGLRLDNCSFDNCSLKDSVARDVTAVNCRVWACHLGGLTLENCVIENLAATVASGGGRRMPITVRGARFNQVVLRGKVGTLLLGPPWAWLTRDWPELALDTYRDYYGSVDWALDISAAHFTSVPTLRFVPGELVRIDPERQAVLHRRDAQSSEGGALGGIGVWRTVIDQFLRQPWPDATVLATGGSGRQVQEQTAGLRRLREAGIAQ